jgi:hypothetical protein
VTSDFFFFLKQVIFSQMLVAHTCNLNYSGGRDEDYGLNPTQANVGKTLFRKKKTFHNKGLGGVAQGVGPEFKPQYQKKKNL